MKWTYEPGEPFPVLVMTQSEVKQLVEILKGKVRSDIERRYEKYHDIHESGEATERQCILMDKYEEQLRFIDHLLKV